MALFSALARLAENLSHQSSRLQKRALIAQAVAAVAGVPQMLHGEAAPVLSPEVESELGRFCLYLAGTPFPEADPRKLNAGGALLSRAVKAVSGCTDAALTTAYRRHGDLGSAAHDLLIPPYGNAPTEAVLTLSAVGEVFMAMASARESSSRAALVEGMLRRATALEAKYLIKLMLGDMRIGVKQSLIEEAIAAASASEPAQVRHAVMLEADLGRATALAFRGELAEARMRLFHPLGFMLASPVASPEEAVARFTEKPAKAKALVEVEIEPDADQSPSEDEDFEDLSGPEALAGRDEDTRAEDVEAEGEKQALPLRDAQGQDDRSGPPVLQAFLEDKYDGMRAQIHLGDPAAPGRVAIYSRNREDITQSYPEIVEAFHDVVEAPAGMILDGEILGWDLEANKALPFAILGQRIGRKKVDNELRRRIPVVFMAFDLLFERGELLLSRPLRERRERLEQVVARLAPGATAALDQHTAFAPGGLFAALATDEDHMPRLMLSPAKLVESAEAIDLAYAEARARANEGVMIKSASSLYIPGRRGLAWVKLKRELGTLDVVITGAEFGHGKRAGLLSDYTFAVQGAAGPDGEPMLLNVGKAYSGVTDQEIAELTGWLKAHTLEDHGHFRTVEPLRVLEVAFNNVMRSERHASGFALRFPRILRIRDDKPVGEIDTLKRVEEIYLSQPDRPQE
jgi:DNA ligase-1